MISGMKPHIGHCHGREKQQDHTRPHNATQGHTRRTTTKLFLGPLSVARGQKASFRMFEPSPRAAEAIYREQTLLKIENRSF